MTQDEILAVAQAIEDQLTAEEGWMVGTPAIKRMCEDFAQAAIRALDAARGKAEPVAWVYIRKPEEWPPANPVVGLNQWKYDDPARPYWIETLEAAAIPPKPAQTN